MKTEGLTLKETMKMDNEKKRNVYQRLNAVMGLVGNVPKNGWNDHFKYKFVQETDVADVVREACLSEGLMIVPSIQSYNIVGDLTTVQIEYRVVNIDNPDDYTSVTMIGQGKDAQDKGSNKAVTGCTKYAMLKLFNIGTGDDAEHDSNDKDLKSTPAKARESFTPAKPRAPIVPNAVKHDGPPPHGDADYQSGDDDLDWKESFATAPPDWFQDKEPLDAQPEGRLFKYNPPFKRKDEIKALGAKWCPDTKTWDSKIVLPEFDGFLKN